VYNKENKDERRKNVITKDVMCFLSMWEMHQLKKGKKKTKLVFKTMLHS